MRPPRSRPDAAPGPSPPRTGSGTRPGGTLPAGRLRPLRAVLASTSLLLVLLSAPGPARAQSESYTLRVPSGPSLSLPADTVKEMLRRTRRLESVLKEDPDVLYRVGTGAEVTAADPARAYPWNAVRPVSDSVARVSVPGNYREARRAYYAYAVETMARIREDAPAVRCSEAVEREAEVVSAFVDGWIVARTLYGGPAFRPLDAFVFARDAGHLPAMLVALGDSRLGSCARTWARDHREAVEAYREWRAAFDARPGSASARDAGSGD